LIFWHHAPIRLTSCFRWMMFHERCFLDLIKMMSWRENAWSNVERFDDLIVGSLSESRLKNVRFLVGETNVDVASSVDMKIIKIKWSSSSLKMITYLTEITSYIKSEKHIHLSCYQKNLSGWIRHQLNDSYANFHANSHAPHSPKRGLRISLKMRCKGDNQATNEIIEVYVIEYLWDELYESISVK
jgi:hypothetical protein